MAVPSVPQQAYCSTGNGQVALSWQQVLGVTNYVVQRSSSGIVGSYTTIGSPTVNNYLDTTCLVGVQYWYAIASENASGIGSYQFLGTDGLQLTATPCLPGQINLGYLRYQCKVRTEKLMSQFITDSQWNFYINQSAFRLYDMLVGKYGDDFFVAPWLIIPLTGLPMYPLPNGANYLSTAGSDGQLYPNPSGTPAPACYKLLGVDLNVGGSLQAGPTAGWVPCARQNFSDRDKYTYVGQQATLYNVFQMSYREMGNNIEVYPVNNNATMRWRFVPMMTQLLLDLDMMPFSISGWSELVIVDVCIKALVQEESYEQAESFANERQALIDRVNAIAPNRDAGQPNAVSNTRSTMGDPGFNYFGSGDSGGFFGSGMM